MQSGHESRQRATERKQAGFSLVELMVVVAIIGLISSIALPNLQTYARRSRRSEAFLNLSGIYKAQKLHHTETGAYGSTFEDIGFEIAGATLIDPNTLQSQYYTYTIEAFAVGPAQNANYSAVATGDLDPSDSMLDIIMIEGGVVVTD